MGGNLGDVLCTMNQALDHLRDHADICVDVKSSLYKTAPIGFAGQADFLNAVVRISTNLGAEDLLGFMQTTETALHRVRDDNQFGPRSIDIDLLLFDDLVQVSDYLTLPHPRMHQRRFVLEPLFTLQPDMCIPGKGAVQDLLNQVQDQIVDAVEAWPDPENLQSA